MGQVKVWNMGEHELRERFNGKDIVISPKKFIVMESDEANNYRGQYYPLVRSADGHPDPRSKKILKIEPIGTDKAEELSKLLCHACAFQADTEAELEGHLLSSHAEQRLKDEEAEEKRPRGRPRSVAV